MKSLKKIIFKLNKKMRNLGSESPDFNYKVILVGDQRVGKTSLTNRAVFNEFND